MCSGGVLLPCCGMASCCSVTMLLVPGSGRPRAVVATSGPTMVSAGQTRRPAMRHPQLDRRAAARAGGDGRRAAQVREPAADARRDAEPALADRLVEPTRRDADAVVADRHGHLVAVVVEQHPGLGVVTGVLAHVVEGRLDGGDELVGDPARQQHGVGGRDELHPVALDMAAAAPAGRRHRRRLGPPRRGRPLTRVRRSRSCSPAIAPSRAASPPRSLAAAVDEGERLQHAVVDGAGQPVALARAGVERAAPRASAAWLSRARSTQ